MSKNGKILLFTFLVGSTLVIGGAILGDWLPWLRGPAPESPEWYWPYLLRPLSRWWPSIIAALIFWLVSAWWLNPDKPDKSRHIIALCSLFFCSLFLQLTLIYADRPDVSAELVDRTLSNLASGFFEAAAEVEDLGQALQDYPQAMLNFTSEHARTHPPGLVTANWLTTKTFSRLPRLSDHLATIIWPLRCTDLWLLNRPPFIAAALGFWSILPLLAAALTPLPAFVLARQLLYGRTIRLATVLIAATPALLLFAPKSVQLYPPLALTLLWAFIKGLQRESKGWMLLAGLLFSLLTFLSLGNASLILLLGVFTVLYFLFGESENQDDALKASNWRNFIWPISAFAMGTIAIWGALWLMYGSSPIAIAQTGLQQHYQLVTNFRRYDWWVIWNLIDLSIYSGWPVILGFIGSIILAFDLQRRKMLAPVDFLTISLMITILALNFSGSARGEVGRIWLFIMPFLAYPAARFWRRLYPEKGFAFILVALQLFLLLCLGLSWRPVRAVIVVAERPEMAQLEAKNTLDITFPDQPFSLIGYSLDAENSRPGGRLELTLFWQSEGPARQPYTVFNHLLNQEQSLAAQQDNWPVSGNWPPTCWRSGDTIVDRYTIQLPQSLQTGSYQLVSGLYDAQTGMRLPLVNGKSAIEIEQIEISQE